MRAQVFSRLFLTGLLTCAALSGGSLKVSAETNRSVPSITVTGRGEAEAVPDRVQMEVGFQESGPSAENVQRVLREQSRKLVDKLLELKIPKESIRTSEIQLQRIEQHHSDHPVSQNGAPDISQPSRRGKVEIVFHGSYSVTIEVPVENSGKILDQAQAAGANRYQNLHFISTKNPELRREALVRALRNAVTKAEALADALGKRVELEEVIESGANPGPIRPMMGFRAAAMEDSTAVMPGSLKVEAEVSARFRLLPR
jgi:hypothetical protein